MQYFACFGNRCLADNSGMLRLTLGSGRHSVFKTLDGFFKITSICQMPIEKILRQTGTSKNDTQISFSVTMRLIGNTILAMYSMHIGSAIYN